MRCSSWHEYFLFLCNQPDLSTGGGGSKKGGYITLEYWMESFFWWHWLFLMLPSPPLFLDLELKRWEELFRYITMKWYSRCKIN